MRVALWPCHGAITAKFAYDLQEVVDLIRLTVIVYNAINPSAVMHSTDGPLGVWSDRGSRSALYSYQVGIRMVGFPRVSNDPCARTLTRKRTNVTVGHKLAYGYGEILHISLHLQCKH